MKKGILVLVMITIAATAYNQSSRRTTNANTNTSTRNKTQERVYASNTTSERVNKVNNRTNSPAPRQREVNVSQRKHSSNNKTYTYHKVHSDKHYHTVKYNYRVPVHVDVVWTADMHRHYVKMYPNHHHWNHHYGCRIASVPAYEAAYYIGDVKNVYGRITDVYYSRETDEYILYVGRYYPYQHFTIVVPGNIARRQSHRPGYYYMNQDVRVIGLISSFEGKPEIVVMRNSQINVY